MHCRALKLPEPVREHRFHPDRRWRLDFSWPDVKLAAECEGGIWTNGAHSRGAHFTSDAEKYAFAVLLGWRVLRFTTDQISAGWAAAVTSAALKNSVSAPFWERPRKGRKGRRK